MLEGIRPLFFLVLMDKIVATREAFLLLEELKAKYSQLLFYIGGGCCDGSQPMCFEKGDFQIGETDHLLGKIADVELFISRELHEYYKEQELLLDVSQGRGSSFSIEAPLGVRFILRSVSYVAKSRSNPSHAS